VFVEDEEREHHGLESSFALREVYRRPQATSVRRS
jgi:hypothetical protein